jgi:DNA polymerase-3 subunit epsilon
LKHLQLERPLVVFDLETTGTDPARDKIVEIAVLRVEPDGGRQARTRRINPECPIPPGATAVHGIGDDDVRDEPPFRRVARGLLDLLEGADVAGFNVRRFDLPLLERELREAGLELSMKGRRVVDVMTIFHRKERRDLSAAVQLYLGREHEGAHGAEADVNATLDVLDAQLERYPDLPRSVDDLDGWLRPRPAADAVDEQGKFVQRDGDVLFAFGKHRGRTLAEVAREAPGYLQWIVGSDFPDDAKEIVRRFLEEKAESGTSQSA